MPVHDQDSPKSLVAQRVEQILDDRDESRDAQRRRTGVGAEARRQAVGENGEDGDAERLGGLRSNAFREDVVRLEGEVGVLLGRTDREHDPVVVAKILLELEPVQIAYAHCCTISDRWAKR